MPVSNVYTTLQNLKDVKRITSVNATEDALLERMIGGVSRAIDAWTNRHFYPRLETRLFDTPEGGETLFFDDDLLSLTTLTNGDLTVVTSADYILEDYGFQPYWGVKLRDISNVLWMWKADGSVDRAISVAGEWGYHNDFAAAWLLTDTLSAGVNAAVTALPTTGSALIKQGQIIKIGTEIFNVSSVVTTTTNVVKRGDNGSTAAAHLITDPIYVWLPIEDMRMVCEDTAIQLYNQRFGVGQEGLVTITAAGVVISPTAFSKFSQAILNGYRRTF